MPALPSASSDRDGGIDPDENFSTTAVPLAVRLGRWQVAMSYWSLLSAMVWLFYGALAASLFGTRDAIAAIVLATVVYGVANIVTTRLGVRSGLNTYLLTTPMFGRWGATVTSLLIAATTLYYALFESSTLAVAFQSYFGTGDIRIWYAVVVVAMLPLMLGSVQSWMAKLNGLLLPFYGIGLVATLVAAYVKFGGSSAWLDFSGVVPTDARTLPGWILGFVLYMGLFITMPTTVDFARFADRRDETFHENVTFGWVFYLLLFVVNGLAGIYLVQTVLPNEPASETGVVQAILGSLGLAGLLFIVVSQTRVNTLNYYQCTTNFERIVSTFTSLRFPRFVWVGGVSIAVFLLMLTNVFSYVQTALTWQGVLIVGWVGIVFTHVALSRANRRTAPSGTEAADAPRLEWGLVAWFGPSAVGIVLIEAPGIPAILNQSAQLVVLALSVVLYTAVYLLTRPAGRAALESAATTETVPAEPDLLTTTE
ncbi:purine-cytosine permease family protein [Rhodococcus sp. As11]|uniref:purine-cytosine permease family protein n=1 Tax=Rhodococcus sp. As11 TaxID=3029189 RepID=UPI003B79CC2F